MLADIQLNKISPKQKTEVVRDAQDDKQTNISENKTKKRLNVQSSLRSCNGGGIAENSFPRGSGCTVLVVAM